VYHKRHPVSHPVLHFSSKNYHPLPDFNNSHIRDRSDDDGTVSGMRKDEGE